MFQSITQCVKSSNYFHGYWNYLAMKNLSALFCKTDFIHLVQKINSKSIKMYAKVMTMAI